MKIRFKIKDKEWVLTSDSRQFILNTEGPNTSRTTGETTIVLKPQHFYPRMELLLEDLYLIGLRDNEVDSFRALVKHSEEIKEIVKEIAKKLSL